MDHSKPNPNLDDISIFTMSIRQNSPSVIPSFGRPIRSIEPPSKPKLWQEIDSASSRRGTAPVGSPEDSLVPVRSSSFKSVDVVRTAAMAFVLLLLLRPVLIPAERHSVLLLPVTPSTNQDADPHGVLTLSRRPLDWPNPFQGNLKWKLDWYKGEAVIVRRTSELTNCYYYYTGSRCLPWSRNTARRSTCWPIGSCCTSFEGASILWSRYSRNTCQNTLSG
jgi:hypothetical protein